MQGLHIHGVDHSYEDTPVLNNVSLTVPSGELVCLLGPSGCGKTTLLRIAAGLEKLQVGSISIDENLVAGPNFYLPPEERDIGFMFQDNALFPHLNIHQNVSFGLIGLSKKASYERALEMLDQVSLVNYADEYPHKLSGGQQQRVALARALAPSPRLLLLDEPFSGLDTNMRFSIREETLNMLKRSNVATLMVTHDPREAMYMSDRIKVLGANGQILQSGRPSDIYYKPMDEYVAQLFGPVNVISGPVYNGCLDSSFGPLDAKGAVNGDIVRIFIRLEGIFLHSEEASSGDASIEIISTHLMGDTSVVRIVLKEGPNCGVELQARVLGTFDSTQGNKFWARLDQRYSFHYAGIRN